MFSAIDGGFQFVIKGLFTMDLSWLFMFCFSVSGHFALLIKHVCGYINKKKVEAKIEGARAK